MVRARLMVSALAFVPLFAAAAAHAADYSYPQPPPVYQPPPQPIVIQQPAPEFAGNWYLRGQIGYGAMGYNKFEISPLNPGDQVVAHNMSDAYFIGAGVGYEWNSWLRFDATLEYRFKSNLYALGTYTNPAPGGTDEYNGHLSSWVGLLNAYVDLGTWDCFTPFVGVGVGFARNTISDLVDVNPGAITYGKGRDTSKWNFAWALYGGVTYNVSKSFKVDLTYRYLNLGSAEDTVDCAGGCGGNKFEYKNIYSHDFMIAFRWLCCEVAPPPKYVYVPPPPPVYQPPPPLHSKG
jgi:opacity protein-like surface antigen